VPFAVFSQNQTCTVSGTITDQTGQPVENLTVFIPNTSIGATSNEEGKYILKRVPSGDVELIYRHVAYEAEARSLKLNAGDQVNIDIKLKEGTIEIAEVIKRADQKYWDMGYEKLRQYVLGDITGRTCRILNPEDLYFYYNGKELNGYAVKPLKIQNRYLGYDILYFLDYFKFIETDDSGGGQYVYSGSGLYSEPQKSNFLNRWKWINTRKREFEGSLPHFLICLYHNQLSEYGYFVTESWLSRNEVRKKEGLSDEAWLARSNTMDSVFSWNPEKKKTEYLFYFPYLKYDLYDEITDLQQVPPRKSLKTNEKLLVFYEKYGNWLSPYSQLTSFSIEKLSSTGDNPQLVLNSKGQYSVSNGKLSWIYLDNKIRLVQALPGDYGGHN
jgi:hypothetical protein